MVAKSVKWALASLVVFPPAAFGLGLGDVRLLSALNAPLDAEIELVATPEEKQSLKAQLAPRDIFARNGLDWPTALGTVTVTQTTRSDGTDVLRLRSSQSVTDPFLTLLVEVTWARGRFVREYTMLLDPPVFAPGEQQAAPVAAPATGGAREGAIARTPAPAPREEAPAPAAERSSAASSVPTASSTAEGSSRTVRSGETLSGIASEVAGNSALARSWMLAIYQNNPSAFDGNMNVLRSGAVLRIPDSATVSSISPSEATAEIRRQYASWRSSAPAPASGESEPGRLRLVTPAEPGASGAQTSESTAALQGRVRELEAQLQESRRMLEARNAELAQLQARLSQQPSAAPAEPAAAPPAEAPSAAAPESETSALADQPAAQEETPAEAAEPAVVAEEPVAEEEPPAQPRRAPAVAAEESGGSIFDTLKDYWWAAAALIVALLALLGLKSFRARKRNEFDDSLSRLAASGAESLSRDATGDTQPLRAGRADAFVVEESGTHERPRFGADVAPVPTARHIPADETISSETAINLDQGDPLAEADFHMAYGLYDQAADLVRIAISREPDRRDLKLKLLEVFFVWGNKEQFLQTAHELAETRERAAPGEWEKIVIMGKQLAPEDELFTSGGGGLGGVDLDLEGGQSRVDFDLLGEPVPQSDGGGNGIDLDIGSALGERESGPDSQTSTDANLALHEDGFTPDAGTATTRQMTQKIRSDNSPTVAASAFNGDYEAPTVEQPALYSRDNPTVRQKVEMAMKQSGAQAEQTAELAIDDLGLDSPRSIRWISRRSAPRRKRPRSWRASTNVHAASWTRRSAAVSCATWTPRRSRPRARGTSTTPISTRRCRPPR